MGDAVLDAELAEIVGNLRAIGADIADVEAKKAQGGLPRFLRETLSAFSNTRGGVIILGLDEEQGFSVASAEDPAELAADFGSMCSSEMAPAVRPLIGIHRFEGDLVLVAEIPELDPAQKPCFHKGAGITVHCYMLPTAGAPIFENLMHEEVAAAQSYDLVLLVFAMKLKGSTGLPTRPLAFRRRSR